jgi:hypothetical protein
MSRRWTVERRWTERPDAQRRWDRAYQLLLGAGVGLEDPGPVTLPPPDEEADNAGCRLCTCLDPAPGPGTDD